MKTFLKIEVELDQNGNLGNIIVEQINCLLEGNPFNIVKKEYTPKMSDKLYFLPGVNIPRIKLKEFALNYHIKTTRDFTEADVIFGGNLSNSKVLTKNWLYTVKTEHFKACFEALVELGQLDERTVEAIKTALEFYAEDVIITDWRSVSNISEDTLYKNLIVNPGVELKHGRESLYINEIEEEYLDLVKFSENKEIIDEEALLKHINGEDAVLINKEVYQQLSVMLGSSDTDNHVLAMEIMSNCRLKESLFYLLNLMGEYSMKLKECRSVNHVNFKSLLSYLSIDKHRMSFSTDDKIQKLMDKGVLTTGMLNALIRDELYNPSMFRSTMVQIKTVTVNENIAKYLNKNYEFRYLSEFEPEPEAPKEEIVLTKDQNLTWL